MVVLRTYRERLTRRAAVWALVVGFGFVGLAYFWTDLPTQPWLQRIILRPVAPALSWAHRFLRGGRRWGERPTSELDFLHSTVVAHQAELVAAREAVAERDRLRALLGLGHADRAWFCRPFFLRPEAVHPFCPKIQRRDGGSPLGVAARVIGRDPRLEYRTLLLDRGARDGVAKGMVAVTGAGLVGRIEQVAPRHSTLLLLIDPNHAVDVAILRSRVRGLLVGMGEGAAMQRTGGVTRLEYIGGDADIEPGDMVVTTGLDGRTPKGLAVGLVQAVRRGPVGLYLEAEVLPFVDWGRVEEVVLLPGQDRG